jgi:hypothetical protein
MQTQNKRQRIYRSGVVERYYNCLLTIHDNITYKEVTNMKDVCSFYRVSKAIPTLLQKAKIIQKIGRSSYIWIGNKPSIEMAEMLIEMARFTSYDYIKQNVKPDIIYDKKPVVKVENNKFSFSLFWGLIKFQR